MQTLKYAYSQRHRGVRFRSDGCKTIRVSYDASGQPDPKDGKSQYGYSIMLFDGPIHSVSKKEPRVGTSTTHSEFMAQGEAIKTTLFVQNLVNEMGFPELVDRPTKLQGDNWQATTLLPDQRLTE